MQIDGDPGCQQVEVACLQFLPQPIGIGGHETPIPQFGAMIACFMHFIEHPGISLALTDHILDHTPRTGCVGNSHQDSLLPLSASTVCQLPVFHEQPIGSCPSSRYFYITPVLAAHRLSHYRPPSTRSHTARVLAFASRATVSGSCRQYSSRNSSTESTPSHPVARTAPRMSWRGMMPSPG